MTAGSAVGAGSDDPLRPKPGEVALEPELAEHLLGVGAELGRGQRTRQASRST